MEISSDGLILRSLVEEENGKGELKLYLEQGAKLEPGEDEVVVQIEATPINPSDLPGLLAFADVSSGRSEGEGVNTVFTADIPVNAMSMHQARVGKAIRVGNEGAGKVVKAGKGAGAQALLGKTVALMGGAMYCSQRKVHHSQCLVLNEGTSAREGAACFVNPLTALAIVETMRMDGFKALIHTAAASNLGQMMVKLCSEDKVPLLNVVRKEEQVDILKSLGANYVFNSSSENFKSDLTKAIAETEAYVAFDAIGGGKLGSQIMSCMEQAALRGGGAVGPYGSNVFKQLYVYGALDASAMQINRNFGFSWGINGWLLTPFLEKIGAEKFLAMQQRVVDEIKTTFASQYTKEVSLAQLLQKEELELIGQQATGQKYMINPSLD